MNSFLQKKIKKSLILILTFAFSISCKNSNEETIIISSEDLHNSIDKVVEIMIHDIFSPPVASRIFAYPNIAAYEIISLKNSTYTSLSSKLNGFTKIPEPEPEQKINYDLAAIIAHMELSKKLIFSEEKIKIMQDSLYDIWKNKNLNDFNVSKEYSLKVVEHIKQWMENDNYNLTRSMPKFSVNTDNISRWQPTPPAYMSGIEPHWNKIRPFIIDSAQQFKPIPPPPFSLEKDSDFYKELIEVYNISKQISKKGDKSEEIKIAQFWDCNPYVSVTKGHLMFAAKKITPGAHWIGITKIATNKTNSNFHETLHAYTKTSIAMADAFISCWDEKYRSKLVRPETLINLYIDESWEPILQTPPFPEYTSGHSVVSGAASAMLTSIFGENFSFVDNTEVPYGLPPRSFNSFNHAANEAAISRMYGGIHYKSAVEVGLNQGKDLGNFIVKTLQ